MKIPTLKKRSEFLQLSKTGRKKHLTFCMIVYIKSEEDTGIRMGYAVSKRLGNAVVRNKIKRRLKAAISAICKDLKLNYNILLVARKEALTIDFAELKIQLKSFFQNVQKIT